MAYCKERLQHLGELLKYIIALVIQTFKGSRIIFKALWLGGKLKAGYGKGNLRAFQALPFFLTLAFFR